MLSVSIANKITNFRKSEMIELYFWTTPNGYKPLIFLEEAGLEYEIKPVNIMAGEQFEPEFLNISPNNRIPAMVDGEISVFESGAILLYLAEKTNQFLPVSGPSRYAAIEWLMWQMGGLGPMKGQAHHFIRYADEDVPYGKERYRKETERLIGVLDKQLVGKDYITGEYSVADMASFPWLKGDLSELGINATKFPNVTAWIERVGDRPAVKRAYEVGAPISKNIQMDEKAKAVLFGKKA